MELYQVKYFLALSKTLNFSRAAEACDVSQPSLTRAIKALEAELGGELIRREGRRSHLTDLGERMRPYLERSFENAQMAMELAKAVKTDAIAPLALAFSCGVNAEPFMALVSELYGKLPGLQLRLSHGRAAHILQELENGRLDFALAGSVDPVWERLQCWSLFDEGYAAIIPSGGALTGRSHLSVADLCGRPLFIQVGDESRDDVLNWLNDAGAPAPTYHDVEHPGSLARLLHAADGVAVIPASAPTPTDCRRLPVEGMTVARKVCAYGVIGRPRSAPANAFLNMARAYDFG